MRSWRRSILLAVAGIALASGLAAARVDETFPSRPIRLVISSTAGGQPDMIARTIALKLSETWGRPIVLDNRPGGGGILAAVPVAKATPDGHTLLYTLPNFATSAVLLPKLPYDPRKDFVGVSHIGMSTNVLVVSPVIAAKSLKDLVALAKAEPGKLVFATSATGSASHLTAARLALLNGIDVIQVPYKGGPEATTDVLAGRAHIHVGTMGVTLPFIRGGKLVALGVTTPERAPVLPDVPTLGELMPEFKRPETSHGLVAPAGTPRPILNLISKQIARVLELPDVKARMQNISFVTASSTPEEFDKILRAQIASLHSLVRDAGLRPR